MASIWGFWSLLHFTAEYPERLVRELDLSGRGGFLELFTYFHHGEQTHVLNLKAHYCLEIN